MPRPRSNHPTPAELEVLRTVWRIGPATTRQIMQELNRMRPRAYTSVMSLLNIMTEKRLLGRTRRGRAYVYSPIVRQRQTLREMVADLLERAFDGSTMRLVAHALEQTQPSGQELDEISRLIDEHRRKKGVDS